MHLVIVRRVLLALGLAAGCGDPRARVTLVNVGAADCSRPAGATELRVIAYATSGERVQTIDPANGAVDIDSFPPDTEQLGVEVVVGAGGIGAAGKTAPIDFIDLVDGKALPVFMAPVDGFCPTGDLLEARAAPLVARAGNGVLVVGGIGPGGPLSTAELYDPATGSFGPVAIPSVLADGGFIGAQLTSLPDGRVVLSGGAQPIISYYDPGARAFVAPAFIERRAFHATIATDATHVLLAGGCTDVVGGACGGVQRKSTLLYDLAQLGANEPEEALEVGRVGATAIDSGVQLDGRRAWVIAGGVAPSGAAAGDADRFTLEGATALAGSRAVAAPLDGGGVLTAFAADGAPADGSAAVFVPALAAARPIGRAPDRAGVRLVTLEDGRVLGLGGEPSNDVVRYDPTDDLWRVVAQPATSSGPPAIAAPSLVRLDDGSILVLGGTTLGAPSARAFIYRPSLVGPATGSLTVVPTGVARANVLTATDPATVVRAGDWRITAPSAELARALVGGPRFESGSLRAVVRVKRGGAAMIAQQVGPGQAVVAELSPGAAARIVRLDGGQARTLCRGGTVDVFDPATAVTLELAIDRTRLRLVRDDTTLVACDLDTGVRGAWGIGALGGEVAVDTVTVAR